MSRLPFGREGTSVPGLDALEVTSYLPAWIDIIYVPRQLPPTCT